MNKLKDRAHARNYLYW